MNTTTLQLYAPVAAPVLAAALAVVLGRRTAAWISVLAAAGVLGDAIVLAATTAAHGPASAGFLRADALTCYLMVAVGAVATIACWAGVAYLEHAATEAGTASPRRYLVLVQLFLACMSLAVLANNLGLLWVAIEATTIVTAFLVGYRRTRDSVEAAWKYVVLCSVGIAVAFLGTVCVYAAAVATGAHGVGALDWSYLSTHAHELNPGLIRLAAGLVLVGFGTKAGLAPMHAWLPDAHSQAPAPVSALMSGVLLSVAFYAILRYKTILDTVLGGAYPRTLLLAVAFASLAIAAVLLIVQRDYKRMLAYSSIEHMGLIALGAAIGGPLALAAVLLHILGHGLAKAVAFCTAGRILHLSGTPQIGSVRGLGARTPGLAVYFGLALVALLGFPPFALFASELGIVRAGLSAHLGWAVAAGFALALLAFSGLVRHGATMLLGPGPVDAQPEAPAREPVAGLVPLAVGLVAAAVLGVWLGPLQSLLTAAAAVAGGH
jgi:hydrogenase-4 component F